MTSENPATPTSDDVPPINPEDKNVCLPVNGNISQIPGLSPTLKALSDERVRGRRVGLMAGDSEYIKLAKQGGHKGLLWHNDSSSTSSPRSYKVPDWFSPAHDGNNPSLITSEHKRSPRAFQRREPPFGSDNMSAWEREDTSINTNTVNNNIPDEEPEKLPSQKLERSKFRRLVFDKKPPPVNMSTLLSFGYVGESKPTA